MSVKDGLEVFFLFIWASVATRLDKLVLKTNGHKSKSYGGFESPLAHKLIEIELKRHKIIDFFKNMFIFIIKVL